MAYRRNFYSNAQIQGTHTVKYETILKPYLIKHYILKYPRIFSESSNFNKPPPTVDYI